jgi:predicted aspartyl protease
MRDRGPCIQIVASVVQTIADELMRQGKPVPPPRPGIALIDTGASSTCIDDGLAQALKLPVIDVVTMTSASHVATPQNVYPVLIEVVGPNLRVNVPRAMGANLAAQGLVALIGRDFLQHCTLFYNGITGEITLAL